MTWRFRFVGEAAQDAGGVARDFWMGISAELFDPAARLFMPAATDDLTVQLDPRAAEAHGAAGAARLLLLAGRLLAKALLDGQLVSAPLNGRCSSTCSAAP